MSDYEIARTVVGQKTKQFEAAMVSAPSEGRLRPVGFQPWLAATMAEFQRQPKLCEAAAAAPETVWECLSVAANCGLIPGGASGQFYLIPRWSGKRKRMECTFIIGYKGLSEMAYRHPRVHKCEAFVVYRGEEFDFDPGAGKLVHKYRLDIDRGDENIIAAYSRVVLTVPGGTHVDQEPLVCVMSMPEILKIRDRSEAAKSGFSPWTTDFAAMVRKTPMRRHLNGGSVPKSADLLLAMATENEHEQAQAEPLEAPSVVAAKGLRSALEASGHLGEPQAEIVEQAKPQDAESDPELRAEFEAAAKRHRAPE